MTPPHPSPKLAPIERAACFLILAALVLPVKAGHATPAASLYDTAPVHTLLPAAEGSVAARSDTDRRTPASRPNGPPTRANRAEADTTCPVIAPGLRRTSPDTLVATDNLYATAPARAGSLFVNAVVEIPAGTSEKWEVTEGGRSLAIERVDGARRRIAYLPYPANYGLLPNTRSDLEAGGDGDPLDIVILGPALPCGATIRVRLLGVLRLLDDGERDDKLLAVSPGSPLAGVTGIDDLQRRYPGILDILETWFLRYEGPANRSRGFGDAGEARAIVEEAARSDRDPQTVDR